MTTNVKTGTKDEVDFVVVDNGLTCLIGSTTIQAMGLMTIHVERFISKIDKIDDLGNFGMATLITDCDIAPKILPCRKIPIASQHGVKTELDTLVNPGEPKTCFNFRKKFNCVYSGYYRLTKHKKV